MTQYQQAVAAAATTAGLALGRHWVFDFCAEKAELRVPLGLMQNGSYVDQPKLSLSVSHGFYTQTVRLVETFTLDMRHKSSSSWCSTSVLRVAGTPVSASASAAATSRV